LDGKCKNGNNSEKPELDYWMFQTKDEKGNPGSVGGLMKRQSPQHTVTNFITISSIEEYSLKIEQSQGKIIMPKTEIPNMGFFVVFLDSENICWVFINIKILFDNIFYLTFIYCKTTTTTVIL
jgi:hypothetical protein